MAKASSNRKTLRQKYKIKKKVAEHKRQQKKASKKAQALGMKKRKKKEPGIPNLYPFKQQVLESMQAKKDLEAIEKKEKKEERTKLRKKMRDSGQTMEELQERARAKQREYEARNELTGEDEASFGASDHSRKAYFREFRKVVDESDVILEVLDARDPMGCRCLEIEKFIMQRDPTKRIVLILNKIDLVPKENIQQWLDHLRVGHPTVAFKSGTFQQKRIGRVATNVSRMTPAQMKSNICLGADTLMKLLKNYTRNQNIKTSITVGVIGYPNVGKSSLINSLKREKVVGVGALPGMTKVKQEIHLDKKIRLLDCPGIVFSTRDMTETGIMLRANSIKVDQIDDPMSAVELIVKQCNKNKLILLYSIPDFSDVREFVHHVAEKRGKMKRGGVPNFLEVARAVIQDWNQGKIPFYTIPPVAQQSSSSSSSAMMTDASTSVQIVSDWGKEFDIDALLGDDSSTLAGADCPMEGEQLVSHASSGDAGMIQDLQASEQGVQIAIGDIPVKKGKKESSSEGGMMVDEDSSVPTLIERKKKKKKQMTTTISGGEAAQGDYDFSTDFAAFVDEKEEASSEDESEEESDEGDYEEEDGDDDADEDEDEELVDIE
eukprot:CAMPEP_0201478734 /NCGR_PEP_ID=MMETSP0151_2-20130828/3509_1 /ASSEMBLY_ACC=CAM_ASM_000257 /TAXON_ID=200890 /ORGANISM="Paramoeba atlantica, Strain 621/1 / CCAP 1560/9" /LENGTH=604 /DNA_ID=CAMNT_0047859911 /DNA_START=14 /DNA_END=1828 /DNA_ORIENTATION=+